MMVRPFRDLQLPLEESGLLFRSLVCAVQGMDGQCTIQFCLAEILLCDDGFRKQGLPRLLLNVLLCFVCIIYFQRNTRAALALILYLYFLFSFSGPGGKQQIIMNVQTFFLHGERVQQDQATCDFSPSYSLILSYSFILLSF